MFCKKCGNQIKDGQQICDKCGASVTENNQVNTNQFNNTDTSGLSSIGNMKENVAALLAYLSATIISFIPVSSIIYFAILGPILFYVLEKKSKFVKKHAAQAIVLYVSIIFLLVSSAFLKSLIVNPQNVLNNPYSYLSGYSIIAFIARVISLIFAIFSIIAMVKAYKHEYYSIPLVGKLAENIFKQK